MYPYVGLRPAWERLWSAVHARAPWTPPSLRWDGDVHDHWVDPSCIVAQACGWPVATALRGQVEVVGAFELTIGQHDGHRYRSVILARRPTPLAALVSAGATVAANAPDSLSGWVSLLAATVGPGREWPGPVRWTGGHVASMEALQAGRADVTSVDALSLAYVRRDQPDLAAGLHEIGHGPLVPSLPVVVRAGTSADDIADLRTAFVDALADPAVRSDCSRLLIAGFAALDGFAYDPVGHLGTVR